MFYCELCSHTVLPSPYIYLLYKSSDNQRLLNYTGETILQETPLISKHYSWSEFLFEVNDHVQCLVTSQNNYWPNIKINEWTFWQNLTNTIDSSQVTMWRPWPGRDKHIGFILCSVVAISNFPPSCLITSRPNLRSVVGRPEKRTPSHRCLPWPWAGCPAHAVTMSPVSPVLQNMCGGGDRGWVMQTFSGAKTILWLRDKEELWGADSVSCSALSLTLLWAISMTWVAWAFVYVSDWFLCSHPEDGVTASTIFICRKIFQCLLYPCFLGRGPIISCIFYLYIACFYARLNTMYASLV